MKCAKCGGEMEKVLFEDIEVDRCTWCKGLWFDALEHEHLKAMAGSESIDIGDPEAGEATNEVRKVDCPVCKTAMIKMVDNNQPDLRYESCKSCYGVFFDAGEFKQYKENQVLGFFSGLFHSI